MSELPFASWTHQSVGRYRSYLEAQSAVDHLSDSKFPVENVQIIGTDLRMIEQVFGRLDWGRAALSGAGTGAWFGLLAGLLLGLFAGGGRGVFALLLWGLLYGVVFGAVFGLVGYALTGGKRDFVSRSQIVPQNFDVVVPNDLAQRAQDLLSNRT